MGMICDGSFPTTNLVHWTRDRTRGPKLSIEHMIKGQCRDTAETVGLYDRGLIQPGYRADLNVIALTSLRGDGGAAEGRPRPTSESWMLRLGGLQEAA
jgi:N-acyl-D-aspartate/D-glutamate deacylase